MLAAVPVEGAVPIRQRAPELCEPPFRRQIASLRRGNAGLHGCARHRTFCFRCAGMMVQTCSEREIRAADALFQWSLWRIRSNEACTWCAMHESWMASTDGPITLLFGLQEQMDQAATWGRLPRCR